MEVARILIFICLLMTLLPLYFIYRPIKKINGLFGYRTPRSMKSQKIWDAAQNYFPRILLKLSTANVILIVILSFLLSAPIALIIGLGTWLICFLITLMKTESYLKNLSKTNG